MKNLRENMENNVCEFKNKMYLVYFLVLIFCCGLKKEMWFEIK